jgi:hypothetical protein
MENTIHSLPAVKPGVHNYTRFEVSRAVEIILLFAGS